MDEQAANRHESEQRYTELLLRAGEVLARALSWQETVEAVCDAVVDTVADLCLFYTKEEDGGLRLAAAAASTAEKRETLWEAGQYVHVPTQKKPLVYQVFETGRSMCFPQVDEETIAVLALNRAHESFMRRMKFRSVVVAPVVTKTRGPVAALVVVRTGASSRPFDDRSLRFIEDVALRCATAIGKALLFEQTQRIASMFQRAALPMRLPVVDGIAFDACYEPSSEELLVGGDWYDAFALLDGRIAITVGDVLGHGLEAAVWMSRLRNGFRAALFGDPDPARALEIVDTMLRADSEADFFTTALVALVDPVRQTLVCASAGHPGPLLWMGRDRIIDPFMERGLPLGLRDLASPSPTAQTLDLRLGAFAVFFTDGLLEWNRDIESAWTALQNALLRQSVREAVHPAQAIREAVIGDQSHRDDVAILTVRLDKEWIESTTSS